MDIKPKKKTRLSKKGKIIIIVSVCVAVLAALGITAACLLNMQHMNRDENGDAVLIPSEIRTPAEIKDDVSYFLVVGTDYTNTDPGRSNNLTDFIMLVCYDIKGKEVNAIRIPRDCYIGEDVVSSGKINQVYSDNGKKIEALMLQINKMTGLPIDHYITIDMDGIVEVVDKIGGLEMDVPVSFDLDGLHIDEGLQTINGEQAERILRERHSYPTADLGRIQTQQIFMEAMLKKLFAMGFMEMWDVGIAMYDDIGTDLTFAEMMGYYTNLKDAKDNINFRSMPILGATSEKGLSVLSIKKRELADILNVYFRPYSDKIDADSLDIRELITDYSYEPIEINDTSSGS